MARCRTYVWYQVPDTRQRAAGTMDTSGKGRAKKSKFQQLVNRQATTFVWQFSRGRLGIWHLLTTLLVALMTIRALLVVTIKLNRPNMLTGRMFWILLGHPFEILNSSSIHSELMVMFWGFNTIVLHILFVHVPYTRTKFVQVNTVLNSILFPLEATVRGHPQELGAVIRIGRHAPLGTFRCRSKVILVLAYAFNFFMAATVTFTAVMISFYFFYHCPLYFLISLCVGVTIWTVFTFRCAFFAYYILAYFVMFTYLARAVLHKRWLRLTRKMLWRAHVQSIGRLIQVYEQTLHLLGMFGVLWSIYLSISMIIFNALVCFNSYLIIFSGSPYYLQIVFASTTVTAFNNFFLSTYYAAKVGGDNLKKLSTLSSLIARRKVVPHYKNLKLLECIKSDKIGFDYINGIGIKMLTINSVLSYLMMFFILYISL